VKAREFFLTRQKESKNSLGGQAKRQRKEKKRKDRRRTGSKESCCPFWVGSHSLNSLHHRTHTLTYLLTYICDTYTRKHAQTNGDYTKRERERETAMDGFASQIPALKQCGVSFLFVCCFLPSPSSAFFSSPSSVSLELST